MDATRSSCHEVFSVHLVLVWRGVHDGRRRGRCIIRHYYNGMPNERNTQKILNLNIFPREMFEILGISTCYKSAKKDILYMVTLLGQKMIKLSHNWRIHSKMEPNINLFNASFNAVFHSEKNFVYFNY